MVRRVWLMECMTRFYFWTASKRSMTRILTWSRRLKWLISKTENPIVSLKKHWWKTGWTKTISIWNVSQNGFSALSRATTIKLSENSNRSNSLFLSLSTLNTVKFQKSSSKWTTQTLRHWNLSWTTQLPHCRRLTQPSSSRNCKTRTSALYWKNKCVTLQNQTIIPKSLSTQWPRWKATQLFNWNCPQICIGWCLLILRVQSWCLTLKRTN